MNKVLAKSINLGTYLGIPVKVHWSFFFIFLYIGAVSYSKGLNFDKAFTLALHVFLLFLCVVLHEYGHALSARKYGIGTRDIILSPIGGIARLEAIPENPKEEIVVAFAGPFVNLVIVIICTIMFFSLKNFIFIPMSFEDLNYIAHPSSAIFCLIWINLILFAFNLIPAYPMDGGRILKSLLNLKYNRFKSTIIASTIGRVLAVAFLVLGAYQRVFALLFIGIFVYVMATKEYHFAKMRIQQESKNLQS